MKIALNSRFFRTGTNLPTVDVNFIVTGGGIGDYIGYLGALQWIARNQPQVIGRVFCHTFMTEFTQNVFAAFSHWKVIDKAFLTDQMMQDVPTLVPHHIPVNGMGGHFLELGFIYYMNTTPAPPDASYPTLLLSEEIEDDLFKKDIRLPENYVVLTPGSCSVPREIPIPAFNGIVKHVIEQGLTPLFLGKTTIVAKRPKTKFNESYDLDKGVNLIDRTSLIEAAYILSKAKAVIGLDNGLLHLAGCVNVPLVFGFTVASPEHRLPRRGQNLKAPIYEIYPSPEQLQCVFCQSRMRLMGVHDFDKCLYQDFDCLKILSNPKDWCRILDRALEYSMGTAKFPSVLH